ncbi:type I restriction endonuclease subunit M [Phormidesmis priestleyi ULC007]|uniref:site-specific DNA-methyltransferase (adenine-specific) n=1 Tax=Phormidesmis priestleyi ULC007 TaxID=1920490 RepID=A0A2T1DKD6_9CYAN|nr:DNA methyltransferase [Phormidesmis priestleyi]PSB20933.1 type I restriction endonuclease subunit M [Phormidesmis priestleyi ULC007]PZO51888.1 MAG: type I restriction endonuclease subunit M [Phormidesmis priestleyi]
MPSQPTNSLFHSKTLKSAVQSFPFTADLEERQQKLVQWIEPLEKGVLDEIKEVSLHGQFLADVFQQVLGYRSVIQGSGQAWEIHAEQTIADGGGSADGALGFFTATEGKKGKAKLQGRVIAPIELKGAKNDLDRPAPGRKESAVDQGWRYANYTADCKWVIVSNYREIRLYQTSKTPAYYESFRLADLRSLETFKRFYFLLCRDNFLPVSDDPNARSRVDLLLAASNEAEDAITKDLYQQYKTVRINLTQHFWASAPDDILDREAVLIEKAQKLLDRMLFIAFCEDRRLLPEKTIRKAHDHRDQYNLRPIWENYKAVFRWVDVGNDDPPIPGYNGGLFKPDRLLDERLEVTDSLCTQLKELARFDFDTEVSVNILGHIFEQSVTDLEELKALATGQAFDQKKGKRKTQGVYYTPAFVTQYIVEVALGGYLKRKEQELIERSHLDQISKQATRQRREAEIQFWEAYRDILLKTRVIDPACGSGAFLIAAFDYLNREYERVNEALAALEFASQTKGKGSGEFVGQRSLFDLNKTLLNENLYGVDLSPESVEITKLSLWLKTAEQGKALTYLDDNIKVGNSIVADLTLDRRAFNWEAAFPQVFADGGFDVVIGNPPYVRQELLTPFKSYLQQHYESYDGVADLYAYFYEKGLKILKPDGMLSYIVTNKWFKAGYGESLRRFFAQNSVFEQILDFGHAPIFADADTFPCIVSVRASATKLEPEITKLSPDSSVRVCPVPREKLKDINLSQYVQQEGFDLPWSRFTADAWSLEPSAVEALMQKIKVVGVPLKDFAGISPLYGTKTGLNEAFVIDGETRNELIKQDNRASEIIKPFLRGQDINRWNPQHAGQWMIYTTNEVNLGSFPAIERHLAKYREKLEARAGGQNWWQLQGVTGSYRLFEKPKIVYQEIQFHSAFGYDESGLYINNKAFILPTSDLYLLGVLNSPLLWWYNWRYLPHMKDEALSPSGYLMQSSPIAPPTDEIRSQVEPIVTRLIEITKANQESDREVQDWLRVEQHIEKLGQKLEDFSSLDCDLFVQEVKTRKPKNSSLNPKALKELREVYNDYAPKIQTRKAEALAIEIQLSDLVNQAYGLTPEEIDLMWKTAPPRMPIPKPTRPAHHL